MNKSQISDCKYTKIELINKTSFVYDGRGEIIDGKGKYAHLLKIHDCKDLVIKNVVFQNGDTSVVKYLNRSDIAFRNTRVSIFEIIDGGAVVITGKSKVKFENCKFFNNNSIMCGGAISNQSTDLVTICNCLFENNTSGHTGCAIDNLVRNANIIINNCEFVNNKSNTWYKSGFPNGQITVFPNTKAEISYSTFRKGSIPIDFVNDKDIVLKHNKYIDFNNWQDLLKHRKSTNLFDLLNLLKKLYWVVPKTLGKVYFRVNR